MSRTRGASQVFHDDDGELLDKEGKPINPIAHVGHAAAVVAPEAAAPEPVPEGPIETPQPARYRCDATTCQRDMDGWELIRVLSVLIGGELSAEVGADAFGALPADVRRHFRRVG